MKHDLPNVISVAMAGPCLLAQVPNDRAHARSPGTVWVRFRKICRLVFLMYDTGAGAVQFCQRSETRSPNFDSKAVRVENPALEKEPEAVDAGIPILRDCTLNSTFEIAT